MPNTCTYVDRSPIHGKGLYAAVNISSGDYIGTFRGPSARRDGTHVLWLVDEEGNWYGKRGTNALRYVNHRRNANAEFWEFDLYAIREIAAGEEITIDYGW